MSPYYLFKVVAGPKADRFISEARRVLRGTDFSVVGRARNPNRKQFYKETGKRSYGWDDQVLKHPYQDCLPYKHASYLALYLRDYHPFGKDNSIKRAKKAAKVVKKLRSQWEAQVVKKLRSQWETQGWTFFMGK